MNFDQIQTTDQFWRLHDEWNALLESSPSACVFLTHEWLFTWWKHFREDRRLSILTARREGELVGILPVAKKQAEYSRMTPPVLEFLGSGVIGSDYLDAIAKRDWEQPVMAGFAASMDRQRLAIRLSQTRRGDCLVSRIPGSLREMRWKCDEAKINVCPFIDLRGHTWESYAGTLGSSQRYNFNRRLKNLTRTFDMRVEFVRAPEGAESALEVVIDLHRKRWGSTGASEAFQTPEFTAFHREFVRQAAERGWLRILILRLNDAPAAALYGLRYGSAFYFYQSGFDPDYARHSVGLVMMGLSIRAAIEEGVTEYDLLHGDEEYKFHWARTARELGRLELYPPGARGGVYRRAVAFNRAARRMAKRVLNKGS